MAATHTIIDFLEANNIKWFPLQINIVDGKKQPPSRYSNGEQPKLTDFKNLSDENIKERQNKFLNACNMIAIDTNIIQQIDIDTENIPAHYEELKDTFPYFNSATKQLPHFFVKIMKDELINKGNRIVPEPNIDILNGQWSYCLKDNIVYNANAECLHMEFALFSYLNQRTTKPTTSSSKMKPTSSSKMKPSDENRVDFDFLKDVLTNLSPHRSKNYDDWSKIGWTIHNISKDNDYLDKGLNLFKQFSRLCPDKYDEYELIKLWNDTDEYKNNKSRMGTLINMLKEDNLNYYSTITMRQKTYQKVKENFEKKCFKVNDIDAFGELTIKGNLILRDKAKFNIRFEELTYAKEEKSKNGEITYKLTPFLQTWYKDCTKRVYSCVDYCPPPLKCCEDVLNNWKGMYAEHLIKKGTFATNKDISPILYHINVMCNFEKDVYEYMLKWIAQMIQEPGKLSGVAILLQSTQGAGKFAFQKILFRILGDDLARETAKPMIDLFSKHSEMRKERVLISIDETKLKDTLAIIEELKNAITSPTFNYEKKGIQAITYTNTNRFIFLTNNIHALRIDKGTRRFVLIQASGKHVGDVPYFNKLHDLLDDDEVIVALYNYFMDIDISNVKNFQKERPITKYYKEIQKLDFHPFIQFMEETVCNGEEWGVVEWSPTKMFNKYVKFCDKYKFKYEGLNVRKFGSWISLDYFKNTYENGNDGLTKTRNRNGYVYKLEQHKLFNWLKSNNYTECDELPKPINFRDEDDTDDDE